MTSKLLTNININPETGLIEPAPGISPVFDSEKENMDRINAELEGILAKWKKKLGVTKAYYVSVRAKNEI